MLVTFGISTVIATGFELMGKGDDFGRQLATANAIGLCMWLSIGVVRWLSRERMNMALSTLVGIPLGFLLASKALPYFGGPDFITRSFTPGNWRIMAFQLLIAASAASFAIAFYHAGAYRTELEAERRRAAEARQAQTAAELALLQAQIEPHFLFNTLAHVQSMIESDPRTAKAMLDHLTHYLREALGRTRNASYTLGEELGVVESLLAIAAMRLDSRLRYHIRVHDDLRQLRLPPLLLQPLVENAIKHGIEPAVNGGEIRIECDIQQDALVLRVSDTGVGLDPNAPEGVGLGNVRARLASLYGAQGRLALQKNEPSGVVAELTMPTQRD
jgi:signal transduction histidine kinase